MLRRLILAISLLPTLAFAQQPTELTFKVTPAEIDVIAKGLETQPFKDVAPLLQKLRQQFTEQQAKPEVTNNLNHMVIPKKDLPEVKPVEPEKPKE